MMFMICDVIFTIFLRLRNDGCDGNVRTTYRLPCESEWMTSRAGALTNRKHCISCYPNVERYTTSHLLVNYLVYFFLLLLTNQSILHMFFLIHTSTKHSLRLISLSLQSPCLQKTSIRCYDTSSSTCGDLFNSTWDILVFLGWSCKISFT